MFNTIESRLGLARASEFKTYNQLGLTLRFFELRFPILSSPSSVINQLRSGRMAVATVNCFHILFGNKNEVLGQTSAAASSFPVHVFVSNPPTRPEAFIFPRFIPHQIRFCVTSDEILSCIRLDFVSHRPGFIS